MVILGIDPGFRYAGYGILKKDMGKTFLLEYGCLKLAQQESLSKRTNQFYTFFKEKINKWQVSDIALETPFLGKNAQNFLKLGYLRGIIYLLADQHGTNLREFTPSQVKQALTGFGSAQKDQVARVILRLFNISDETLRDDVTDALAITVCGLWQQETAKILYK